MRRRGSLAFRIARRIALGFVAVLVLAAVAVPLLLFTGTGRSVLVGLAETVTRAMGTPVTVASVGGSGLGDLDFGGITVADREGVWLKIDRLRLAWRPRALLSRTFAADTLDLGQVDVARAPLPASPAPAPGPLLPALPVGIDIKAFQVATLALAAPVASRAVELGLKGSLGLPRGDGSAPITASIAVDGRGEAAPDADVSFSFVPAAATLATHVTAHEPGGGVLHRMIGLAGDAPLDLTLSGDGKLDDWNGVLALTLGDEALTRGNARIARVENGRRITADLAAILDPVVPEAVRPVTAGETSATLDVMVRDDGDVEIAQANAKTAAGSVALHGSVRGDTHALDLTLEADLAGSDPFAKLLGDAATWQSARLTVQIGGTATAPTANATGTIAGPAAGVLAAASAQITASTAPAAKSLLGAPSQNFALTARLAEATLAGKPLTGAGVPAIDIAGRRDPDGSLVIERARGEALAIVAEATGRWQGGTGSLDLKASSSDLGPLGAFLGQPLKGGFALTASAEGDPATRLGTARIDLTGQKLITGQSQADALTGGAPHLTAALSATAAAVTLETFSFEGAKLQAQGSGSYGAGADGIALTAKFADLSALSPTLGGQAELDAKLSGSFAAPAVAATLRSGELIAAGERMADVVLKLDADRSAAGDLAGHLDLAGSARGAPISGTIGFADGAGGQVLDIAKLQFVGLEASGKLTRPVSGAPAGRLTVRAPNVAPVAALAGLRATGGFEAALDLGRGGGEAARLTLTSKRLGVLDYAVEELALDATITDPLGAPRIAGTATAARIAGGGLAGEAIRIKADGPTSALGLDVSGRLNGATLAARGTLALPQPLGAAGPIRLALASFAAERSGASARLSRPGTVSLNGQTTTLDLALAVGSGAATVAGTIGPDRLGLDVRLDALPLTLADLVAPDLRAVGSVAGRARISGSPSAPAVDYDLTVRGARISAMPAAMPSIEAALRGRTSGDRLQVAGRVSAGSTELILDGTTPMNAAGRFDLGVRGTADLAMVSQLAPSASRRVAGQVALNGRLVGTIAAPDFQGDLTLNGASASDVLLGFAFQDINGRVRLENRIARITAFTAVSRDGGTVTASGTVDLDATRGMPADITVAARSLVLRYQAMVRATATADVKVSGPLLSGPAIAGSIDLGRVDVTVPDRLPTGAQPIAVVHENVPPSLRGFFPKPSPRKAGAAAGGAPAPAAAPFAARLDLTISASRDVYVSGQGIQAEFTGSFRLTGTSGAPIVNGGLNLRRGTFDILTQRLEFTRGSIAFVDSLDPVLDLVASSQASSVVANVTVTGRASAPQFAFSSEPPLPPDEVLSQLLFNKASSGLSVPEGLMLARALTQLTGVGGRGPDVIDQLQSQLGLGRVDLTTDRNDNPTLKIGRYATNNVYIGVQQGLTAATTGVTVNVDVSKNIRVQGTVASDGSTTVGVGTEFEY